MIMELMVHIVLPIMAVCVTVFLGWIFLEAALKALDDRQWLLAAMFIGLLFLLAAIFVGVMPA